MWSGILQAKMIKIAVIMLTGCLMAGLSGCTGKDSIDPSQPYAEEVRYSQEHATSEFEKSALEDGVVSRDEYLEALERYVSCIESKGSAVGLVEQGGIFIYEISGDISFYDSIADGCDVGTKGLLEPLYINMLADPEKKGYDFVTAQCMVDMGVVDKDFTSQDYAELYGRETEDKANDPLSRAILDHPDTINCFQNPGYANMQNNG